MSIIQEISAHRTDGWQGQYSRMMRWVARFKILDELEMYSNSKSHDYFDTLYACFQNAFMLKDWLIEHKILTIDELDKFVNNNIEVGICRDICNGTKHFNLKRKISVTEHFGIIREFNPLSKINKQSDFNTIIISGGLKFSPLQLITRNIELWDALIENKLELRKR